VAVPRTPRSKCVPQAPSGRTSGNVDCAEKSPEQDLLEVERTGIEPVTSGLQSREGRNDGSIQDNPQEALLAVCERLLPSQKPSE
jgi:hypothetical protein